MGMVRVMGMMVTMRIVDGEGGEDEDDGESDEGVCGDENSYYYGDGDHTLMVMIVMRILVRIVMVMRVVATRMMLAVVVMGLIWW